MSSCRCGDITNWESKIQRLSELKDRIEGCAGRFSAVETGLNSLSVSSNEAFESNQKENLITTVKLLNEDLVELIMMKNGFRLKQHHTLKSLSSQLSSMRQEDYDYHEEERRRAEEESAAAAAKKAKH